MALDAGKNWFAQIEGGPRLPGKRATSPANCNYRYRGFPLQSVIGAGEAGTWLHERDTTGIYFTIKERSRVGRSAVIRQKIVVSRRCGGGSGLMLLPVLKVFLLFAATLWTDDESGRI